MSLLFIIWCAGGYISFKFIRLARIFKEGVGSPPTAENTSWSSTSSFTAANLMYWKRFMNKYFFFIFWQFQSLEISATRLGFYIFKDHCSVLNFSQFITAYLYGFIDLLVNIPLLSAAKFSIQESYSSMLYLSIYI